MSWVSVPPGPDAVSRQVSPSSSTQTSVRWPLTATAELPLPARPSVADVAWVVDQLIVAGERLVPQPFAAVVAPNELMTGSGGGVVLVVVVGRVVGTVVVVGGSVTTSRVVVVVVVVVVVDDVVVDEDVELDLDREAPAFSPPSSNGGTSDRMSPANAWSPESASSGSIVDARAVAAPRSTARLTRTTAADVAARRTVVEKPGLAATWAGRTGRLRCSPVPGSMTELVRRRLSLSFPAVPTGTISAQTLTPAATPPTRFYDHGVLRPTRCGRTLAVQMEERCDACDRVSTAESAFGATYDAG